MDTLIAPNVIFTPEAVSSLNSSDQSQWLNNVTYQFFLDIADEEEQFEFFSIYANAKDTSGNTCIIFDSEIAVYIDNKNPEPLVYASTYDVTTENSGTQGFQIFLVYDEPMASEANPVLSFPLENPLPYLTFNQSDSEWLGDTFLASYDVNSNLEVLPYIDVNITEAHDVYGNSANEIYLEDWFSILLDTFLNVPELNIQKLTIYPNPTDYMVNISFDSDKSLPLNGALQIFDIKGQLIYEEVLDQSKERLSVNTSSWKSGVYTIQLLDENTIAAGSFKVAH